MKNNDDLDKTMYRRQEYDNVSTMAEGHSEGQVRIRQHNPKVLLVTCTNHFLNLCVVHSFATVPTS